jgi:hypothetical protein
MWLKEESDWVFSIKIFGEEKIKLSFTHVVGSIREPEHLEQVTPD